jgi:uncharacterized protein
MSTVERVEEVAQLFPANDAAKRPLIEQIHRRLQPLGDGQVPRLPVIPPEQLAQMLTAAARASAAQTTSSQAAAEAAEQISRIGEILRRLPREEYFRRLSNYQQQVAGDLMARLRLLQSLSNPEPPAVSDLTPSVAVRMIGRSGKFLLRVYGKGNIWNKEASERFVADLRSVDKDVTGNPVQVYEATRHMKRSYELAAVYSLVAICVLLAVEFRNLHYPLLAMLPVTAGMAQMFGLMGILNIPVNQANMIVLPLLLGLGAENGIHIMNDFRRRKETYRRMSPATTTTVMVNSLTTMVGFAALMVANHQGLVSLGRVLTLVMSCCLLSALVLPNLLVLFREKIAGAGPKPSSEPAPSDNVESAAAEPYEPVRPRWIDRAA